MRIVGRNQMVPIGVEQSGWPPAAFLLIVALVGALPGCHTAHNYCRRCEVSTELATRMGQPLGTPSCPGETAIPPGVEIADGVTEDEAIALALWNNAAYQETLSQLGISEAQTFDAGLLRDPQLAVLFPLGPKQFEFTAYQFVDGLWLRPIRLRAAELGLSRVAEQMVQNGLDVIRDVRLAHADLVFAQQNGGLANEAEKIRHEIAELAQKRLEAGDISELEANDSRVQELIAKADAARIELDVVLAQQRLVVLTGLAMHDENVVAVKSPDLVVSVKDESDLVGEAMAMRPDLRAAEIGVEEATRRVKLAEKQWFSFELGVDANSEGSDGFEASPALRLRLPIFNRNRGNIAIAKAQLQQAMRRHTTVRDQITLDVRTSYATAQQASGNLETVKSEILPTLETAVGLARKNYLGGGTSYFLVLQTTSQFLDARARELRLSADLRRAVAELERSVGHRFLTNGGLDQQPRQEAIELPSPTAAMEDASLNGRSNTLPAWRPVEAVLSHESTTERAEMLSSDKTALGRVKELLNDVPRKNDTGFDARLLPERMRGFNVSAEQSQASSGQSRETSQ